MALSTEVLRWPRRALPVIRSCGRFPMTAHNATLVYVSPRTIALHLHDYTGTMWLGSRPVRLQPGDFTLTPARLPSNYDLDLAGTHVCVHFTARPPGKEAVMLPLHWRPGTRGRWLTERLLEIIRLQRDAGEAHRALAEPAAGYALQSLLLELALVAATSRPGTAAARTRVDLSLEKVRRHLDEHYREPLDVPDLARQCDVSQNYLAQRFRARHGLTIQRYLLGRRIELAEHLLRFTRLPLKVVAVEAGLGNAQYFHRQFRRATGTSPSSVRAQALAAVRNG
ncbi:MAG: helix-turn-helix domain-containing protein [Opitutales bacterium]